MLRRAAFAPVLALAVAACRDDTSAPLPESFATSFFRMWIAFDRDNPYIDYKGVNWSTNRRRLGMTQSIAFRTSRSQRGARLYSKYRHSIGCSSAIATRRPSFSTSA